MEDYIGVYLVYIYCELNCRNFNISKRISYTFCYKNMVSLAMSSIDPEAGFMLCCMYIHSKSYYAQYSSCYE